MPRYRLSPFAKADLAGILAASGQRWGSRGRSRYSQILIAAMRQVAAEPDGPATRDEGSLRPGLRSFPIRYARVSDSSARIRRPVHVLYYRAVGPGLIEIVRVLHERMDPSRHLAENDQEPPAEK